MSRVSIKMSYHLTHQGGPYIQTATENSKCWQGCGEVRTLCPAGGTIKRCHRCERQRGSYSKIKNRTPIVCSNPVSECIPTGMGRRNEKDTCTPLFIAAVATTAKRWFKEPKCSWMAGQTKCGLGLPRGVPQPPKGRSPRQATAQVNQAGHKRTNTVGPHFPAVLRAGNLRGRK